MDAAIAVKKAMRQSSVLRLSGSLLCERMVELFKESFEGIFGWRRMDDHVCNEQLYENLPENLSQTCYLVMPSRSSSNPNGRSQFNVSNSTGNCEEGFLPNTRSKM